MPAVAERPPVIEQKERIARAVFVSPISVSDFRERLSAAGGRWQDTISLTNVHLVRKSSSSKPSAGLVMAIGGTADPKETRAQAAMRESAEETRSVALHEKRTRAQWDETGERFFEFSIPGGEYKARALSLEVLPVSAFALNVPREKENGPETEDKIAGVLTFSPTEFQTLVTEGVVRRDSEEFLAAGHFTTASVAHDPIEIDGVQRAQQEEILTSAVQEVEGFDQVLKRYTLGAINKIRFLKEQPARKNLGDCTIDEITTGFVAAQMKLALTDERAEETADGPNRKASLLRVLPYLTSDLPAGTLSDLLLYLPTHETVHQTQLLAKGFKEGIRALITSNDINMTNEEELLTRLSQDGEGHDIDAIAVLHEVWPTFRRLPDVKRVSLLKKANEAAVDGLARAFNVQRDIVVSAIRGADGFHDFITHDLTGHGKHQYFHDFVPLNEITNAGIFAIMTLALGYHPHREDYIPDRSTVSKPERRTLRFEALRHLALVSVGVEVAEKLEKADNSFFEAALDSFFDEPTKKVVEIVEGQLLNIYDRETIGEIEGRRWHIRINEALKKRLGSGVRKRFNSKELKDLMPISIVVSDDNFDPTTDSIERRIEIAAAIRDQFIAHARERVAEGDSGWTIEIDDHRTKAIEEVKALSEKRQDLISSGDAPEIADEKMKPDDEPGGKGPGSAGEAIIRDKFFMVYHGPDDEEQTIEVNIYPFESSNSPGVEWLGKLGKWGHREWSRDNALGLYLARRLTERDGKNPMRPTLAEDLYLSLLYEYLMEKTGDIRTRKSKLTNGHAQQ